MEEIPDDATLVYIRLKVNNAAVVYQNKSYPVEVPSGKTDIHVNRRVASDTELVLDFDAARSVRCVMTPTNPTTPIQCKLIPVIDPMFRNRNAAKVEGTVKDSSDEPVDFALVVLFDDESSPVRATLTNKFGKFLIGGVKPGSYGLEVYTEYSTIDYSDETEKNIYDLISGFPTVTSTELTIEEGDQHKELNLIVNVE